MWKVLGNIASICSIVALPIALWQIYELKSKVEATERGIRSVLDIKEYEKLSQILNIVMNQYQELGGLLFQVNKKGKSVQTIIRKCQDINREINFCIVEIPPQHIEILNSLNKTVEHLEKFMESDMHSNTLLKDARDYLNNAMQGMKQEEKVFENKTVVIASHISE